MSRSTADVFGIGELQYELECTPVAATPGACSAGRPERQPFQRIPGGSSVGRI